MASDGQRLRCVSQLIGKIHIHIGNKDAYMTYTYFDFQIQVKSDILIDGFGSGSVFKGTVKENVWTYIADSKIEGKDIKFRWTAIDESPGLITGKSELSINGSPWILGGEAKAVRE